jgi:beta-glucosidase
MVQKQLQPSPELVKISSKQCSPTDITMAEEISRSEKEKVLATAPYKDSRLPVAQRVADLLSRMTLEEKIAQMLCIWGQRKALLMDDTGVFSPEKAKTQLPNGIGQIARLGDTNGGLTPRETAVLANRLQKHFFEETRLGIPVVFHEECLHGLVGRDATSYPQPIGLGATFDPALIEEIYRATAADARSRGVHQALTPVVDVAREPRWGRVEETFGEDPYLVAQMGIAAVRGFQGDATFKDKKRVIATLKHFAAHGQPESGMNCAPVNVSERLLRDTFLYTFREVIVKANALSVMPSYNEIDGLPSHANSWLLGKVLRGEWGFKGTCVSDYYAITELDVRPEATSHAVADGKADAARLAIEAGVNIELPDPDCYPYIGELVKNGKIRESALDALVAPLLEQKFNMGLFEDPYVDPENLGTDTRLNQERPLALRAARETITLLKNQRDVLPLKLKKNSTIAVIGPNADRVMLGGYTGTPRYYTTVLKGIIDRAGSDAKVLYSEGCKLTRGGSWTDDAITFSDPEEDRRSIAEAAAVAGKADVVVLVIGGNEQTSREAWNRSHMGDRANLNLFGMQNDLVRAVVATGKPVVAVLFNGRPNSINILVENVPAILECWYLGQETGNAVAEVLFGDYNPGGKLPMSFPRSAGQLPCYYNYKPSARRGYLADDVSPLFAFGFGLSYTKFSFSNVRLEKQTIRTSESTRVLVDVKNTGDRAGDEVVQMYIHDRVSSVTRPVKELKGFARISLKPGETRTVAIPILPEHLEFTTVSMKTAVEPGDFEIQVGNSSRDADLITILLHVTE